MPSKVSGSLRFRSDIVALMRQIVIVIFTSTGNSESGNVVGALITTDQEPSGGIDGDDSWIIPER